MWLQLNTKHCFLMWMAVGLGSNTRAKLLATWGLFYFSYGKDFMSLGF